MDLDKVLSDFQIYAKTITVDYSLQFLSLIVDSGCTLINYCAFKFTTKFSSIVIGLN